MDKFSALTIAQTLIAFPSVTPEDAGAQAYLAGLLTDMGFTCHHLPFADIKNLFARLGTSGPHLCYAGHTDVVPPGPLDQWTHDPFTPIVKDGVLYGRGASDMKGSVACFIAAAHGFVQKHGAPQGSLSLLITGDEEGAAINGTVKVLEWMNRHNHIPDVALVGEPTNPDHMGQEIKIGRRGSLSGHLTVFGKQGHVAYPQRADNPAPKLAQIITLLSETPLDKGTDYFQASNLEFTSIETSKGADNVIPAQTSAKFNIRFNDLWTCASLEKKIREILDTTGHAYDLHCIHGAQSFITKPGEWSTLVASAVTDITGKNPSLTTTGGTSDARFIAPYCPVIECGAINKTIHQIDENVDIADLDALTALYLSILEKYFLS